MPEHDHKDDPGRTLDDDLLEAMLGEAVGAAEVPDLRARIALELRKVSVAPDQLQGSGAEAVANSPRPSGMARVAMALAAGFLLGFAGLYLLSGEGRSATVQVAMFHGETEYTAGPTRRHFVAGDDAEIQLGVGDRFTTQVLGGAIVQLRPLGTLILDEDSTVEIRAMNWTKKDGGLVVASLTVGAVVGGFTWNSGATGPVQAGETEPQSREEGVDESSALVKGLRKQITSLQQENSELQTGLRRKQVAEAEAESVPEPTPEKAAAIVAMFEDPEFKDALAKIDWQTMGGNLHEMMPLIEKLAAVIEAGGEIPLDIAGEIHKLTGDLTVIAKVIMDAKIPGAGIGGAITHPSVMSNRIAATLQAAGVSLDQSQLQSMEQLRAVYAAKDKSLRNMADSRDIGVENLLEEADAKSEFYDAARAMLSPEQRAVLPGDAFRGRLSMDPFGTGRVLGQYTKGIRSTDAADFVKRISRKIRLDVDAAGQQKLDAIFVSYANKFPPELWTTKPNGLDSKGMLKSSRVREALRHQIAMMREVVNTVPMTAKDLASFKREMFVLVPMPR